MADAAKAATAQLEAVVTPSAESAQRLVTKLDELQNYLDKQRKLPADRSARLKLIEEQLTQIKNEVAFKNGRLDANEWADKAKDDRQRIMVTLDGLLAELTDLNLDELHVGRQCFGAALAIFAFLLLAYFLLHTTLRPAAISADTFTKANAQLQSINLEIRGLIKAKAKSQNGALPPEAFDNLNKAVTTFRDTAVKLGLSNTALQLLGKTEAEVTSREITETDTFANLSTTAAGELASLRSFLWSDPWWRWAEIAFWAELGTLVGILFYISGSLSQGHFAREEITMFLTEILSAPIVIVAIFFLFNLTGITGISPNQSSITEIVGLAFIFGFAIRRTLGLLDNVKKRLFPEPAPAGASAKE